MKVNWERYRDFFDLYAACGDIAQLVYVIGNARNCYIGSVGSRGGQGGLRVRYEPQYINRARAIYGQDRPSGQPAFVGIIDGPCNSHDVANLERHVQRAFVAAFGRDNAEFKPPREDDYGQYAHAGQKPSFL